MIESRDAVHRQSMGAKNALEGRAGALDRGARPLVASIHMQADAEHSPSLEGMGQLQELALGIRPRADRAGGPGSSQA